VPLLGVVGGRGEVDLDAGFVEREPGERHQVLPADQPADAAQAGLHRFQPGTVALAPNETLVVGRHELAVVERQLPLGAVKEQGVVDRAAVELVRSDREPHRVLPRDPGEAVGIRPGDLD
jgi:hypothetical protein